MQIEYLASYAGGMGVLEVDCVAGCSCPSDVSIDAHTPLVRASRGQERGGTKTRIVFNRPNDCAFLFPGAGPEP